MRAIAQYLGQQLHEFNARRASAHMFSVISWV
jgi:hypothetical protein